MHLVLPRVSANPAELPLGSSGCCIMDQSLGINVTSRKLSQDWVVGVKPQVALAHGSKYLISIVHFFWPQDSESLRLQPNWLLTHPFIREVTEQ